MIDIGLKNGEYILTKAQLKEICDITFYLGEKAGNVIQICKQCVISSCKLKESGIPLEKAKEMVSEVMAGDISIKGEEDEDKETLELILKCTEVAYDANSKEEAIHESGKIIDAFIEEQKAMALKPLLESNNGTQNG